jgi:putative phosphoesterase
MITAITVGILSDTHGFLDPRIAETVNQCDYIIHAGDIMGAHVLRALEPGLQLHAVAGNNDNAMVWIDEEADVVNSLPSKLKLNLPGGLLIIEHGHRLGNNPEHDQLRWDHAEARLVIYGHTHKRVIDTSESPWVVNPGAAGKVRTKGGPSCLVLNASESDWHIKEIVFPDSEINTRDQAA